MKKLIILLSILAMVALAGSAWAEPYLGAKPAKQIKLAWDPCTWADGVNLYISTTQGNYTGTAVIKIDAKTATLYDLNTLTPQLGKGTYYAIATAYTNAGAESGPSNEVSWTWDPTIPLAPTNLKKQ